MNPTEIIEQLLIALREIAEDHPPNDWKAFDVLFGYRGYGDSPGTLGYVPVPDESNKDDVHDHGVAVGMWKSATVARAAIAIAEGRSA